VTKGLQSGDYSILGMEDEISIERKNLDDLFSSVTWGRARFENEIKRLDSYSAAFVIIEATWPEIMEPTAYRPGWVNRTEPRSVEGTIIAWSLRYSRVHWWACGSRREAEKKTFAILRKYWQEKQ
jgi:ERCC4-type nuclease